MLLFWGIFTIGFIFGAILSFVMFAAKNPQEDPDYNDQIIPKGSLNAETQIAGLNPESAIIGNSL